MANAKEQLAARVAEAVVSCLSGPEFDSVVIERARGIFEERQGLIKPLGEHPEKTNRSRPKSKAPKTPKAKKKRLKRGSVPAAVHAAVKTVAGDSTFSSAWIRAKIQERDDLDVSSLSVNQALKKLMEKGEIEVATKAGRSILYRRCEKIDPGLARGERITDPVPPRPEPEEEDETPTDEDLEEEAEVAAAVKNALGD